MHFPRASRSLHLPFTLPFIPDAYFLLVVVWKIIEGSRPRPRPAHLSIFFVVPFSHPKRWDGTPPHNPARLRLLFNVPSVGAADSQLIVISCRLKATTQGQDTRLPLCFLMRLALAPQTRELTAAQPNLTARALQKPL
jgi:hypothetical protein